MNYIERNIKRKAYFSDDAKAFEGGLKPTEFYETPTNNTNTMEKKYRLLRDLPGHEVGTIFVEQHPLGWRPEIPSGTYIFYLPTTVVRDCNDWFEEVQEPKFTKDDMEHFAYFVYVRTAMQGIPLGWGRIYLNDWMKENKKS